MFFYSIIIYSVVRLMRGSYFSPIRYTLPIYVYPLITRHRFRLFGSPQYIGFCVTVYIISLRDNIVNTFLQLFLKNKSRLFTPTLKLPLMYHYQ